MGTRFFQYVRDPRVPPWRRYLGLFAMAYALFPLDVIPDFLPLVGWMDDLGVLTGAAWFLSRELERYRPAASGWPVPVERPGEAAPPSRGR